MESQRRRRHLYCVFRYRFKVPPQGAIGGEAFSGYRPLGGSRLHLGPVAREQVLLDQESDDPRRKISHENPGVITPFDRTPHFGLEDHVRLYGRDFCDCVQSAGFRVDEHTAIGEVHGFLFGEKVFIYAQDFGSNSPALLTYHWTNSFASQYER